MKLTVYGISKKFPSVKNVSCEQLSEWMADKSKKLVCLVCRRISNLQYAWYEN